MKTISKLKKLKMFKKKLQKNQIDLNNNKSV